MSGIKCPKCGKKDWIIKEEVCIGQDGLSVECECNTSGCLVRKNILIDISSGMEDLN